VYDKDLVLLSESLKWCWSDTTTVDFTDKAIELLLQKATELHKRFYCEMIPLASIDLKWKIARLSVSMAYLTLSTEDFTKITVNEDHVTAVVEFLETEYTNSGLNILAQETKYEKIDAQTS